MNTLGTSETIQERDFVLKWCTLITNGIKLDKIFEILKQEKNTAFFLFTMKSAFLHMQFKTESKIFILPTFLQKFFTKTLWRFFTIETKQSFLQISADWYYQAANQTISLSRSNLSLCE